MDTRFPPPPHRVRVPLYPNNGKLTFWATRRSVTRLAGVVAKKLDAPKDRFVLTRSASHALHLFLKAQEAGKPKSPIRVAMPAYNCTDIVDAVIASGCEPVFVDVDEGLQINSAAVEFADEAGCSYLLWPNYFGTVQRDENVLKNCKRRGLKVIFDEAQTFPVGYDAIRRQVETYAAAMLVSFGSNKAVAGLGGGALYRPDGQFKPPGRTGPHGSIDVVRQNLLHIADAVRQRVRWYAPGLAAKFIPGPAHFDKLVELLEHKRLKSFDGDPAITPLQAQAAWRNYQAVMSARTHRQDFESFRRELEATSPGMCAYLDNSNDVPAIVALKVGPAERYRLMSGCSARGIQVTWYYYPLHMVARYRKYKRDKLRNTEAVAGSVMIVPFGWAHSRTQKHDVLTTLQDALAKTGRDNA